MGVTVLLDTHVLLWAVLEPKKLSDYARELLLSPTTSVIVSAVSAWEIATKVHLGRLDHARVVLERFPEVLDHLAALELEVTSTHAFLAGGWELSHRDPFDRMLAAQSKLEGFRLLSADPIFTSFPVDVVW